MRKWVPERANLSVKWIHCPWGAPVKALSEAVVVLGMT